MILTRVKVPVHHKPTRCYKLPHLVNDLSLTQNSCCLPPSPAVCLLPSTVSLSVLSVFLLLLRGYWVTTNPPPPPSFRLTCSIEAAGIPSHTPHTFTQTISPCHNCPHLLTAVCMYTCAQQLAVSHTHTHHAILQSLSGFMSLAVSCHYRQQTSHYSNQKVNGHKAFVFDGFEWAHQPCICMISCRIRWGYKGQSERAVVLHTTGVIHVISVKRFVCVCVVSM